MADHVTFRNVSGKGNVIAIHTHIVATPHSNAGKFHAQLTASSERGGGITEAARDGKYFKTREEAEAQVKTWHDQLDADPNLKREDATAEEMKPEEPAKPSSYAEPDGYTVAAGKMTTQDGYHQITLTLSNGGKSKEIQIGANSIIQDPLPAHVSALKGMKLNPHNFFRVGSDIFRSGAKKFIAEKIEEMKATQDERESARVQGKYATQIAEAKKTGKPVAVDHWTETRRAKEGGEWGDYVFVVTQYIDANGKFSQTANNTY